MLDRQVPTPTLVDAEDPTSVSVDDGLLESELHGEVFAAFRELDEPCRRLLHLLCTDPPMSYAEIAATLGKSTGYIGPTRARCLARLRAKLEQMKGGEPDA